MFYRCCNLIVGVTGFEPAKSPGPKPGAIPSYATPRIFITFSFDIYIITLIFLKVKKINKQEFYHNNLL